MYGILRWRRHDQRRQRSSPRDPAEVGGKEFAYCGQLARSWSQVPRVSTVTVAMVLQFFVAMVTQDVAAEADDRVIAGVFVERALAPGAFKLMSRQLNPLSFGVDHEFTFGERSVSIEVGVFATIESAEKEFRRACSFVNVAGRPLDGLGNEAMKWGEGQIRFRRLNVCVSIGSDYGELVKKVGADLDKHLSLDCRRCVSSAMPRIAEVVLAREIETRKDMQIKIVVEKNYADDEVLVHLGAQVGRGFVRTGRTTYEIRGRAPSTSGEYKRKLYVATEGNVLLSREVVYNVVEPKPK